MFYKAKRPDTGNMWDVWLYHHEDNYYLFSLCKAGEQWDNFSMARSPDGVRWTELGSVAADGSGFKPEKTVDRAMRFPSPARFRLAVEGVLLEIYLDDILIECYSLPAPASGRIGLIPGNRPNSIGMPKAWKADS